MWVKTDEIWTHQCTLSTKWILSEQSNHPSKQSKLAASFNKYSKADSISCLIFEESRDGYNASWQTLLESTFKEEQIDFETMSPTILIGSRNWHALNFDSVSGEMAG